MSSDLKQLVGSILMFVGEAGIATGGWGVFFYAAGAALLYSGGKQRSKEAQEELRLRDRRERSSRAIKANVRGSSEVHYVCFGKVRVGGIICALGNGGIDSNNARKFYIGIAHSLAHPGGCEGVSRIWINDERIELSELAGDPNGSPSEDARVIKAKYVSGSTYMVKFRHYRGTSTQSADPELNSENILGGRSSSARRRGIAWTVFKLDRPTSDGTGLEDFEAAFPQGIPSLSVELKGNRCYDPRLDTTVGGSGSHRYDDPTTWAWTQNSALVAATYMIMEVSDGGMGYDAATDIDWSSVAAAASICDETLTIESGSPSVQQARYRCDIALDTSAERRENLQKILDTMQGARVRVGNKFKLYAGAYRSPTFTFDETYLRGGVKVATRSSLESLYNAVRVLHDDENQNYRNVEAPAFTSSTYEAQDGGERLWREEHLSGVTNTYQAQYIGALLGAMSRHQKVIECPCNLKALDLECWETGAVTLSELGISGVYRIISWEWEGEGPKIVLREESSASYTVTGFSDPAAESRTELTFETPPAPSNLSATVVTDGVSLRWDSPAPSGAREVDIYRSNADSPTVFTQIGTSAGFQFVDPVSDGETYTYRVRRRDQKGTISDWSDEVEATSRTVPTVTSPGSALPVLAQYNADENQYELNALASGDGVSITQDEDTKVITITSTSVEKSHLGLSSDFASSSTTLADVTDFKFPLEPNTLYEIEMTGVVRTAATSTGFKIGATAPSGTSLMVLDLEAPSSTEGTKAGGSDSGTTSVSVTTTDMPAANTDYPFVATFLIKTGAETGSPSTGFVGYFQPQFATEVGASAATLKANSLMVLSKITNMTPTATMAIVADPGIGASYTSDDDDGGEGIVVSAKLTYTIKADGTWTMAAGPGDVMGGSPSSGNWGTPTTPGAGIDYEAQIDIVASNGIGSISNPASSWTTISADIPMSLTVLASSGSGTKIGTLTARSRVRKRGTTTPVSDDTFDWSIASTSSGGGGA